MKSFKLTTMSLVLSVLVAGCGSSSKYSEAKCNDMIDVATADAQLALDALLIGDDDNSDYYTQKAKSGLAEIEENCKS